MTSKVVSKAEGRVRQGEREAAIRDETVRVVARRGPDLDRGEPAGPGDGRRRRGRLQRDAGARRAAAASTRTRRPGPCGSRCTTSTGRNVAVIVTDTAGRAWRTGQTDLAVGVAGLEPLDDLAGPDRLLRQRAGRDGARRGRRARLASPSWSPASSAGDPSAWCAGSADRVLPAGEHGPGARALVRPREQDMFALGAREAVLAAVRGRDADCFGAPASTEEMLAALESCGLAGSPVGASVQVVLPADARDQVARPSGSGWWPTPTAGARTATRRRGTPSRSHRRLRRLRSAYSTIQEADEWPRRTRATTSGARSPSRCARSRRARNAGAAC